jgi:hypothetical protein
VSEKRAKKAVIQAEGEQSCRFCSPSEPCRFHRDEVQGKSATHRQFQHSNQRTPFAEFRKQRVLDVGQRNISKVGYHIVKPRVRAHQAPSWTMTRQSILQVVRGHGAFHLWNRWFYIAWRYYKEGWSAADIASVLECSTKSVERVLERLNVRATKQERAPRAGKPGTAGSDMQKVATYELEEFNSQTQLTLF